MAELFSPPQNNRLASQAQPKSLQKMSTINWRVKKLWQSVTVCSSKLLNTMYKMQRLSTCFFKNFLSLMGLLKFFSAFCSLGQLSSRGLRWKLKFRPPCRNTYHYAVVERERHRRKLMQNRKSIGLNLFVFSVWFVNDVRLTKFSFLFWKSHQVGCAFDLAKFFWTKLDCFHFLHPRQIFD